uniref:Uncharacterized protein n=1 Tax=Hyaloperonospora arabidopsidis (strain Emoy2) TaxID=559515 RepID=M4C4J2_HYAAE
MQDEQQQPQEQQPQPQHQEQQQQHEHKLEIMGDLRHDAEDEDEDDDVGGKRRLFRFKPAFDVVLAREVIRCFPWAAGYGRTRSAWMNVAARVQSTLESLKGVAFTRGSALDHAIVKRRVDMLLEAFRKHEMSSLRGTGTPEEFDMRNKLLAILTRVVGRSALIIWVLFWVLFVGVTKGSLSPGPVPQTVAVSHNEQPNGSSKRSVRTTSAFAPALMHEVKRPRVEKTAVTMDVALSFEEQKLRLEERRVALEEERLEWEKQKAQQDGHERQALLDLLRAQSSLVAELLVHLRTPKVAMDSHDL